MQQGSVSLVPSRYCCTLMKSCVQGYFISTVSDVLRHPLSLHHAKKRKILRNCFILILVEFNLADNLGVRVGDGDRKERKQEKNFRAWLVNKSFFSPTIKHSAGNNEAKISSHFQALPHRTWRLWFWARTCLAKKQHSDGGG